MTAIGGFVDIGNLVTSGVTGARFGTALAWAIVLGTIGMTLYGEMAGRVSAVARRPVFDAVRERLGVRVGLVNLVATVSTTWSCPARPVRPATGPRPAATTRDGGRRL